MIYNLNQIDPELFKNVFKDKTGEDLIFNKKLEQQIDILDLVEIIMEIEKRLDIGINDFFDDYIYKEPKEIFVQFIRDEKLNKILGL